MKTRTILCVLLFAASLAQGAALDMRFQQRNATDTGDINRLVPFPGGGANGLFWYNGSTTLPSVVTLGANLNILAGVLSATSHQADWAAISGPTQILNKPTFNPVAFSGLFADVSGKPTTLFGYGITDAQPLDADLTAIAALATTSFGRSVLTQADAAAIRSLIGAGAGSVTSITAGTGLSGGVITTTGTLSLPNTGTSGTYSSVTTDAQGRVIAGTTNGYTYTTRALNTCFQASTTRPVRAVYNAEIVASATLVGGQRGTLYLETFTDSACTAGTQEVMRSTNGNTNGLIVALGNVSTTTLTVSGTIPTGLYAKLRTQNNTGTPTFTAMPGQEVAE